MGDKLLLQMIVQLTETVIKTQEYQYAIINLLSQKLPALSQEEKAYLEGVVLKETEQIKIQRAALDKAKYLLGEWK